LIGFIFCVLAVSPLPWAVRSVREFDGSAGAFFRIAIVFIFAGVMAAFGIASLLKARRISRS